MAKKYYWLKLKDDFFVDKRIKKLRKIAGGDTYTIIYLKMMLSTLISDGIIEYEGIEETLAEELALELDEDADNVQITLEFLEKSGLLIDLGNNKYEMPVAKECMGSETSSAQRVRDYRERQKAGALPEKHEPKSNALRQKQHRAKEKCQEKQHVPYIEDYMNNKRYSGNYYVVIQRDKYRCAICGSIEDLCVHHIDGFDEAKPENNAANKMITLCRCCHSNIHAGKKIDEDILDSIDYYSNEMLPGNTDVTEEKHIGNVEKEIEKDKEKREDKEIEKKKKKDSKESYGALGNVKLTIDEYNRLVTDYGYDETQKAIEYLDGYIADKGYKSKDNNRAMRRWVFDAVKEQEQKRARINGNIQNKPSFDVESFLAKGD